MQKLTENVTNIWGEKGKQWLAALPALTAELAAKYQLTDLQPVSNMSFNYVAAALQNKKPIILKLGLDQKALAKEAICLNVFANHGAVKVLADENGMILMQRATSGVTLKKYFPEKDKQSAAILCECMQKLHMAEISKQHNFYHLSEVLSILNNNLNIPNSILAKARQLRDDLLASTDKVVLLHGDLHHENILKDADGWQVIDPKGFVGDPVFELCAFMHNPSPELLMHENPLNIINARIQCCANMLGYSPQRIQDWLYVKSVLCWAWCLDDNIKPDYFKQFVNL